MTARRKGLCMVETCLLVLPKVLGFFLRARDTMSSCRVQEEQIYGARMVMDVMIGMVSDNDTSL